MSRSTTRSLAGRVRLAAGLAMLLVLVAVPAAGAQQLTWRAPVTLEHSGDTENVPAIACPSAAQCTSVDAQGEQVTFNPASGASVSNSAADIDGLVTGVSCPSTSQCTAVDDLGNEVTFDPATGALTDQGVQSIDNNAGTGVSLTSVSCDSATNCDAADQSGNVVHFNPTTGQATTTNVTNQPLTAISCSAASAACAAVDGGGNTFGFSDTAPSSGFGNQSSGLSKVTSVSCPSAVSNGTCTVVGNGSETTLNVKTPGSSTPHVIDETSGPPVASIALTGIACAPTGTQCVATDVQGKAITFNPANGSVSHSQSIDGITPLNAVDCPPDTTTQCTAVDPHGAAVTFDPTAVAPPGAALSVAPNALTSVTCISATQCTAVEGGSREVTFDPTTNAIVGHDGSGNLGPAIIDPTGNPLRSVSCSSAIQCTAVDAGAFEVTFNPLTGRPNATGTNNHLENGKSFAAVSCSSTIQCTAVDASGNQVTFNPQNAVVNNESPNPIDQASTDRLLVAIDCFSDTNCEALDHAGNAIQFNPKSIAAGTPTAIDPGHHPTGFSCPSQTQCTLVDDAGQAASFDPSTVAQTQLVTGPTDLDGTTALEALSCPTTSACIAVDQAGRSLQFDPTTLATPVVDPVPQAAALAGVSCVTDYECAAVDAAGNGFGGFLPPRNTTLPAIGGTAQNGQTLTAKQGSYANYPATSYAQQWEDCDEVGCSPIAGATGTTYTLTSADVGDTVVVREIATNLGGPSDPAVSPATKTVLPLAPSAQGPPAIVGTVAQGQVLSEQHGRWSPQPSSYAIQWERCDAAGNGCSAIPGATSATYTPDADDLGHALVVQETVTNSGGTSSPSTSSPTAPVAGARAADIKAVTYTPARIAWNGAILEGAVYTQGAPASYSFQYGTSPFLGSSTPIGLVAPGNPGVSPVGAPIGGLRPGTVYYVRLVENVPAGTFQTAVQSLGPEVRFTTPLIGYLHLTSLNLKLTGKSTVAIVGCRAPIACTGALVLQTTRTTGHGRSRRQQTFICGIAHPSIASGRGLRVTLPVSHDCQVLVKRAHPNALVARIGLLSTSGQNPFSQSVELSG